MAFCPKCGKQLNDGAAFCPNCGTAIVYQNVQYQQQPIYRQPYFTFTPQITYPAKPNIPGRGFGITSMVLGILALVCSISPLILTIELRDSVLKVIDIVDVGLLSDFIIYGILGLLSVAFGVCAIVKNFKNGQAISGLIMGGLSLVIIVVSIILKRMSKSWRVKLNKA